MFKISKSLTISSRVLSTRTQAYSTSSKSRSYNNTLKFNTKQTQYFISFRGSFLWNKVLTEPISNWDSLSLYNEKLKETLVNENKYYHQFTKLAIYIYTLYIYIYIYIFIYIYYIYIYLCIYDVLYEYICA